MSQPVQPPDTGPPLEAVYDPEGDARRRRQAELENRSVTSRLAANGEGPRDVAAGVLQDNPDHQAAGLQSAVEGVVHANSVTFAGKQFRISQSVGLMPLMKFANAADQDLDTQDMGALAALYDLLRDCIYTGTADSDDPAVAKLQPADPGFDGGDWKKFERHATRVKAQAEDLLPVVQQVIEILTSRPTR